MGHIYRDSTLTISALSSKRSTDGILKPTIPPSVNPKPVHLRVFADDDREIEVRVERKDINEKISCC